MVRSTHVGFTSVGHVDASHSTSSNPLLLSVKRRSKRLLHSFLLWLMGGPISKMSYQGVSFLLVV